MKEIVKAKKMLEICNSIAYTLEMYLKRNPEQEIEINIHDRYGTNTMEIDIIGHGHKLNRPINFKE